MRSCPIDCPLFARLEERNAVPPFAAPTAFPLLIPFYNFVGQAESHYFPKRKNYAYSNTWIGRNPIRAVRAVRTLIVQCAFNAWGANVIIPALEEGAHALFATDLSLEAEQVFANMRIRRF